MPSYVGSKPAIYPNSVLTAQQIVLASHPVQAYSSRTVSDIPPQLGGIVLTTVPLAHHNHHNHQPRRLRVVLPCNNLANCVDLCS